MTITAADVERVRNRRQAARPARETSPDDTRPDLEAATARLDRLVECRWEEFERARYGGERDDLVQSLWVAVLEWHNATFGGRPGDYGRAVDEAIRARVVERALAEAERVARRTKCVWGRWTDRVGANAKAPDKTPQGRPRRTKDQLEFLDGVWDTLRRHLPGYTAVRMLWLRGEGRSFDEIAADLNRDRVALRGEGLSEADVERAVENDPAAERPFTRDRVRRELRNARRRLRVRLAGRDLPDRLRHLGRPGEVLADEPGFAEAFDSPQRWPGMHARYEGPPRTEQPTP